MVSVFAERVFLYFEVVTYYIKFLVGDDFVDDFSWVVAWYFFLIFYPVLVIKVLVGFWGFGGY